MKNVLSAAPSTKVLPPRKNPGDAPGLTRMVIDKVPDKKLDSISIETIETTNLCNNVIENSIVV